MSPNSELYLIRLGQRLAGGLSELSSERRERHRRFILSQQTSEGGFRGREGDADSYYTGFAVRGLALLGGLAGHECTDIGRWLTSCPYRRLSIIDLASWLYTAVIIQVSGGGDPLAEADADWAEQIAARLEAVRTADGGYAKTTEGAAGSTYHSFLVALCYEMIGQPLPRPDALIQFVYDRQRDDGGFVEIAPMKRSGTNPTAAAVALVQKFGVVDDELRADVSEFLSRVRSDEGGFQANTRIPFADGLSTFTGLLTAQDLALDDVIDANRIKAFVQESIEFPTGGFRAAAWDNQADAEYTFYGLGILGLLNSTDQPG